LQYVILGFGINLLPAAYPADIADRATSLAAELARPVDPGPLLAECLAALARRLSELRSGDGPRVLQRWTELAPSARGSRVACESTSGTVAGVTAGISEDGALLVRSRAGVQCIRSGPVRWL
jgi:BirA family biotin operon repressor/biotin-[acetyl-CoA-carboxylase] ligase